MGRIFGGGNVVIGIPDMDSHGKNNRSVRPMNGMTVSEPTSSLARRGKFYPISSAKLDGVQVKSIRESHPLADNVYAATAAAAADAALCAVAHSTPDLTL